jgi:uncharacterized membrane protein YfcA
LTLAFLATLAGLGFAGAFLSGLLGVGGAVVMIPLLYYVPPRLGVGVLGIKEVSGVTMAQVLAGAVVGAAVHGGRGGMHRPLAVVAGSSMASASLVGALVSRYVSDRIMLAVLGLMAVLALVLLFLPSPPDAFDLGVPREEFDRRAAVAYPAAIGFMSGLVGAGGAFLLMPVLMGLMRIPLRASIGTSLAIAGAAAAAGFLGKLLAGQVQLWPTVAVVGGSIGGAIVGARLSLRTPTRLLRACLGVLIGLVALRIWIDVFSH